MRNNSENQCTSYAYGLSAFASTLHLIDVLYGKLDDKSCSFTRRTLCRNTPAMPLDYLLADGEAHTGPFIFAASAVESLEGREYTVEILFIKPNTVILDNDLTF